MNSWGNLLFQVGIEEVALGLVRRSSKKTNVENQCTQKDYSVPVEDHHYLYVVVGQPEEKHTLKHGDLIEMGER